MNLNVSNGVRVEEKEFEVVNVRGRLHESKWNVL
jgi:hypothetical protein